jgi:secondary thiamine-phosphate synthase enzyme
MQKTRQTTLVRTTRGQGFYDLTSEVRDWVGGQGIRTGLLTLYIRHTTASLVIQENADPDVLADLSDFLARLAPEAARYRHRTEGPDDMPGHIRAALLPTQLSIPVADGAPALGTWQAIYLVEHRRAPQRRTVVLHLAGE